MGKFFLLCFFIYISMLSVYSQNIDFESIDEKIEQSNKDDKTEDNDYNFMFGLGYKYIHWEYSVERPSRASGSTEERSCQASGSTEESPSQVSGSTEGSIESVYQSSDYNAMVLDFKFTTVQWHPMEWFVAMNIYFPLSIADAIYPKSNSSGAKVTTIPYLLKNLSESQNLKGLGLEWVVGSTYKIQQEQISFLIGGGLATNIILEDFSLEKPRGSWGLGIGLDVAVEFQLFEFFGINVGFQGNYYPLVITDINNTLTQKHIKYEINSSSLTNMGFTVSTVWYF